MALELALEPLCPGADPRQLGRAAIRARLPRGLAAAAVVAAEGAVRVERERDVAVPAATRDAAGAAVKRRCDAAPVEEQDRLAAPLREPAQLGEKRRRERIAGFVAQVDDADGGHRRGDPAAELEPLERVPGLGPRRRRAEDRDRALESRPLGGDGAGVVARVRLLLVRRVVFLVDADHAERGERREHRRARADDDGRLALDDPLPLVPPLGLGQAGVEQRDAVAEARAEAAERLRGERDLRHEDDRAAAGRERGLAGADVDLGLPAAGRAGQEDVAAAGSRAGSSIRSSARSCEPDSCAGAGSAARPAVAVTSRRSPRRCGLLRRDQRERAGRRRAVVVGEPEGEVDERRRQRLEHPLGRDRLDVGRRLGVGVDDDAAAPRVAEAGSRGRRPSPPRRRSRT